MLIVDRLLVSGIRFVLDKVATAVETEMNDVDRLREELLAAQMRFELGEIDAEQLQGIEHTLMPQIRAINERQREELQASTSPADGEYKYSGIEAEFMGDPTGVGEPMGMSFQRSDPEPPRAHEEMATPAPGPVAPRPAAKVAKPVGAKSTRRRHR